MAVVFLPRERVVTVVLGFNPKNRRAMKKIVFSAIVMALVAMCVTSCKKEENDGGSDSQFYARLESDSDSEKTSLETSGKLSWESGDEVEIYWAGTNNNYVNGTYVASPVSNATSVLAYLNPQSSEQTKPASSYTGSFYAIYPSTIATGYNVVTLSDVQESSDGSLANFHDFPMFAKTDGGNKTLTFKNLCSVLKVTVQGASGESINKIQIVADKYLNGDFTIDWNDGEPTLTATTTTNHTKIVTLNLTTPQSISSARDFYVCVPANSYNYFQIKIFRTDGASYSKTYHNTTTPLTLSRSHRYDMALTSNVTFQTGALSGLFTVNSDGLQVRFAKGNLLMVGTNNYKFADNQYDRKEGNYTWLYQWAANDNTNTSMNVCWKNGQVSYISNGGANDVSWRCLSRSEWNFVLNIRAQSSSHHIYYYDKDGNLTTTATNKCYTLCSIGSIKGMLIFPDVFCWPLDNKQPSTFGSNGYSSNFSGISLTMAEWQVLEAAGCVFLPTTGYTNNYHTSLDNETTDGAYWSSQTNPSKNPFYTKFSGTSAVCSTSNFGHKIDYYAYRLVKNN